jgi:hypothetical protein
MTGKGQKKQPPAELEADEPNKTSTKPTRTSPKATTMRDKRMVAPGKLESLEVSLKQEQQYQCYDQHDREDEKYLRRLFVAAENDGEGGK